MRLKLTGLILICSTVLAGCAQHGLNLAKQGDEGSGSAQATSLGVLGSLRPKADPKVVAELRQEDEKQRAAQMAAMQEQAHDAGQYNNGLARLLPRVSTDPIAPPAEDIAKSGPVFSPADNSQAQMQMQMASSAVPGAAPPQAASYGSPYASVPPPPPGALGGSLVPPPPAVTLSTQAAVGAPGGSPYDSSPYANPYMNPYAVPYPQQQQQIAQPIAASRPSGSFFGGSGRTASDDDDDKSPSEKKKLASFVPITPSGMDSRSSYKQADDLKVLWKGALSTPAMREVMSDGHMAEQVNHISVGLPGEATKGNFNVSQRQIDNLFKGQALDRRIAGTVKKVQSDVAQNYYRYLYSYNRFALAEQTLAARKQESDVAGSASEQQRAAADLAQAQTDVESARDDMRSAQNELATVAGPVAARSIIAKVSGVAPSLDALAQPEQTAAQRTLMHSVVNPVSSLFHFGHGGKNDKAESRESAPDKDSPKLASADTKKIPPLNKEKDRKKESKKRDKGRDKAGDLTPAPAASVDKSDATASSADDSTPQPASSSVQGGISFELKGVNVQPRKSILTVAIRNNGTNSYSFSPDLFSVAEGNRKLSEAAVRADFDSTMVQPNAEVKGTITIFGRPWTEKLAVVLTDGSRTIQLRR